MSYFLADTAGPLDEFASIGGYADFVAWAREQEEPLKSFVHNGFTEDLAELAEVLSKAAVTEVVQDQVDVLREAAQHAKDIIIVSDGMSDELRALASRYRETPVHAAADAHFAKMNVAVLYAFSIGRRALGRKPNAKRAARAVQKALLDVLPSVLTRVVQAGGEAGFAMLKKQLRGAEHFRSLDDYHKMKFDGTNPNVAKWAREHAAELAKNLSAQTEQDIKDAVERAVEEGGLQELYDDILNAVGSPERADLIARTEVMTAANEGQRESWAQAVDAGLLTGDEKREWIATDSACDECMELDGEQTELDGVYPGDGEDGPPLHPNCRCTEGIVG